MRFTFLSLLAAVLLTAPGKAQVPVFEIDPAVSTARFAVKGTVSVKGTFDKWDAAMTFTSTDPTTGTVEVKIQTASVNTGSGMKDKKLKGKDFLIPKSTRWPRSDRRGLRRRGRIASR